MNCDKCNSRLEEEEERDIRHLIALGKPVPKVCTECLDAWVEEPAKTEWDK